MELVGSVVAAYLIAQALEPALDRMFVGSWYPRYTWRGAGYHVDSRTGAGPPLHVMLLAAIGVLRALVHRRAGHAVLYRSGDPAPAIGVYVAVALGHTALCVLAYRLHEDHQSLAWAVAACLSLGWPIALLVATRRPAIRQALRGGRSATAASAPDQVATLMVFFGLVGSLVALFALYASIDNPVSGSPLASWLPVAVTALLCLRSAVHVRVGLRLTAGDEAAASAPLDGSSYVKVALGTAALSTAAILILPCALPTDGRPGYATEHLELARRAVVVYLLVVWPLLLARAARVRAEAPPSTATAPRSAAGLSAVGWLLLASGAVPIGFAALSLYLGGERMQGVSSSFIPLRVSDGGVSRGARLQLLVAVPQIWVAVELLRGSARRRAAATLYAACASVATVLAIRADMDLLMRVIGRGQTDVPPGSSRLRRCCSGSCSGRSRTPRGPLRGSTRRST